MPTARPSRPRLAAALRGALIGVVLGSLIGLASCGSVELSRTTESSGTFHATGFSFTLFSVDLPTAAIDIARGNASDTGRPNMVVTDARVTPYFGRWCDWLFEIVGWRRASVSGTWGVPPTEPLD